MSLAAPLPVPLRPPRDARRLATELDRDRKRATRESETVSKELARVRTALAIAPAVEGALQQLSERLFEQLVRTLEEKLTIALQEVLEQPIRLRADSSFKRGTASLDFYIERNGQHEDIIRGQGGSVANVLSVGLRMFALATLPDAHRRFLVLDEQDCWLRPDLVPRFVKIIHQAGQALGFQVLMISHHDAGMFSQYADRIWELSIEADGSCMPRMIRDRQRDTREESVRGE